MRIGALVVAALVASCVRNHATPTADISSPLSIFMNVCAAPGLTPNRVIRYAESNPAWIQQSRYGDFDHYSGDIAELVWITPNGDRDTRLRIGGYYLNKWFALPLDNDVPSYECKVEFSGGDPHQVVRALRAVGFLDIDPSRRNTLDGSMVSRVSPDRAEHPARSFQMGGHGCIIDFEYDLQPLGPVDWHSRSLNAYCPR